MDKDLIIVRAGPTSLHNTWLEADPTRSWDLYVCPYQELPAAADVSGVIRGDVIHGPKWTGLRTLLNEWEGWRSYRYIVLADDDLFAMPRTWSRFFETAAYCGAKLAAPALTPESVFSHWLMVQNTEFMARQVSFVEIMAPCFRGDILGELMPTLDLTETGWGWGLDILWAKLLSYEGIFIIDQSPVIHPRPLSYNPRLLEKVRAEMDNIMTRHSATYVLKTLSGIDILGNELRESDNSFLYRLFRGYQSLLDRSPDYFRDIFLSQLASLPPA